MAFGIVVLSCSVLPADRATPGLDSVPSWIGRTHGPHVDSIENPVEPSAHLDGLTWLSMQDVVCVVGCGAIDLIFSDSTRVKSFFEFSFRDHPCVADFSGRSLNAG
jgi:hypothetical protein